MTRNRICNCSSFKILIRSGPKKCDLDTPSEYWFLLVPQVGFKPAGGIRTSSESLLWLVLVKEELGSDWLHPQLFRLGASSLLADIERQVGTGYNTANNTPDCTTIRTTKSSTNSTTDGTTNSTANGTSNSIANGTTNDT